MSIRKFFRTFVLISMTAGFEYRGFGQSPESAVGANGPVSKMKLAETKAGIDDTLRQIGQGVEAAIWFGEVAGMARIERHAFETMPSASAIKTFFLVEFFASHKDTLDGPVSAADTVLADDAHPAIAHFTAEQKQDIRKTLAGRSARALGEIMMGKAPASNVAYNAAANVIIAVMGGPQRLTDRIKARDPAFSKVFVRRYMLRDRNEHGDNETTAAALAALYRNLAARRLNGVEPKTVDAIRNAIIRTGNSTVGFEYIKTGALDSDPLTRVEAGWKEPPAGAETVVFVVMLRQPNPGRNQPRGEAGKALAAGCTSIRKALLEKAGE